MNIIAVDVGNSRIKFKSYEGLSEDSANGGSARPVNLNRLRESRQRSFACASGEPLLPPWIENIDSAAWCIVSVNHPAASRIQELIASQRPGDRVQTMTHQEFGLRVDLPAPERVGRDRLAAAMAAWSEVVLAHDAKERSGEAMSLPAAVIVDAGSAVTVDLVSPQGAFLGGTIFPGRRLMYKSLATYTAALPDLSQELTIGEKQAHPNSNEPLNVTKRANSLHDHRNDLPTALGKSTGEAIRGGVYWSLIGSIRRLVEQLEFELQAMTVDSSKSLEVTVFLTGGDAADLAPQLPKQWLYRPDLVLEGGALSYWTLTFR
jgi:type III pantothenate kinase